MRGQMKSAGCQIKSSVCSVGRHESSSENRIKTLSNAFLTWTEQL